MHWRFLLDALSLFNFFHIFTYCAKLVNNLNRQQPKLETIIIKTKKEVDVKLVRARWW